MEEKKITKKSDLKSMDVNAIAVSGEVYDESVHCFNDCLLIKGEHYLWRKLNE